MHIPIIDIGQTIYSMSSTSRAMHAPITRISGYMNILWYQQSTHGTQCNIWLAYKLPAVATTD